MESKPAQAQPVPQPSAPSPAPSPVQPAPPPTSPPAAAPVTPPPSIEPIKKPVSKFVKMLRIIIPVALLTIVLFAPVPYYQKEDAVCGAGQTDCPKKGWHVSNSVFQTLLGMATQSNKSNNVPAVPVASPSATPDPMATWKTFTGKVFQYKYPDNLYFVDLNFNDSIDLFADKESADASTNCFKDKLGTQQNPCQGSLMQIMITSAKTQEAPQTASTSGNIIFSPSTNPQGLQMLKNETAIGGMGKSIVFTAFIVKSPMTYTVTVQTTPKGYWQTLYPNDTKSDSEILSSESVLLNQILSTFKFITPSPPVPVASVSATPAAQISDTDKLKSVVTDYLALKGYDRTKLKILAVTPLGKTTDKYNVSYIPSVDHVGGGLYILIGVVNGEWVIPDYRSTLYCEWVNSSTTDENTIAFMGCGK